MTARLMFEYVLIELNKQNAPHLKLYEFNYLANKAINLYVNKIYNVYELNQQTTDALRVLETNTEIVPTRVGLNTEINNSEKTIYWNSNNKFFKKVISNNIGKIYQYIGSEPFEQSSTEWILLDTIEEDSKVNNSNGEANYEFYLPLDYLHLLNCICTYTIDKSVRCLKKGLIVLVPALKLTSDSLSAIMLDVYNRPSPERPYYYIHNVNTSNDIPTNPVTEENNVIKGTDQVTNQEFPRKFKLINFKKDESLVDKPIASRYGNPANIRCEIRYGKTDEVYKLTNVQISYLKVPQHIHLTQQQVDLIEDKSQILEFPDYVNLEIINQLVTLVLEKTNNPRLVTHSLISLSIAVPTGQLQTN